MTTQLHEILAAERRIQQHVDNARGKPADQCLCGCGQDVSQGKQFRAGHDTKAVWEIVRKYYGNTEAFLRAMQHNEPDDKYDGNTELFLLRDALTSRKATISEYKRTHRKTG